MTSLRRRWRRGRRARATMPSSRASAWTSRRRRRRRRPAPARRDRRHRPLRRRRRPGGRRHARRHRTRLRTDLAAAHAGPGGRWHHRRRPRPAQVRVGGSTVQRPAAAAYLCDLVGSGTISASGFIDIAGLSLPISADRQRVGVGGGGVRLTVKLGARARREAAARGPAAAAWAAGWASSEPTARGTPHRSTHQQFSSYASQGSGRVRTGSSRRSACHLTFMLSDCGGAGAVVGESHSCPHGRGGSG